MDGTEHHTMIRVLDYGYVSLIESWGSDERIIEAARMSTNKGFAQWDDEITEAGVIKGDARLLRYLYTHNHMSPFEMCGATFEIKAPIFVFREWHRHRTQSYNEVSARYVPIPDEHYLPSIERMMVRADSNKQAQGSKELSQTDAFIARERMRIAYNQAEFAYQDALEKGVPKVLARLVMPVGRYSRMMASANLRNWLQLWTGTASRGRNSTTGCPRRTGGSCGSCRRRATGARGSRCARRRAVIPGHRRPAHGAVAALAVGAQARAVGVVLPPHPVAVVALRRRALDGTLHVAALTRYAEMPPFEIEAAGLVERPGGAWPALGRVARLARASAPRRMRIGMAGGTGRGGRQVRARRVARRAVLRHRHMAARQGKPGLSGVIEVRQVKRPEVGIGAAVLHVRAFFDPEAFRQIVLNLVRNALDAVGEFGRITVETRADGERAMLEVADDGPGIPPEERERIFEFGYSTKPGGSGLGLPSVQRLAVEMGGSVSVDRLPDRGTVFRVTFPVAPHLRSGR